MTKYQPIRKIRQRVNGLTGKFPSLKMQRNIWWEYKNERDFLYLLEIDHDVKAYYEQPFRITYYVEGVRHSYTPDFLVIRERVRQVVEVKEQEVIQTEEFKSFAEIMTVVCEENGYEFVLMPSTVIKQQPRLANIKLLYKYSRNRLTPNHIIALKEFFAGQHGDTTVADLARYFRSIGILEQYVYTVAYWGYIRLDINQPLTSASRIFPVIVT